MTSTAFPTDRSVTSQPPLNSAANGYAFEKFCVMHIATTCDEHGMYVTRDSAEVIEIGWVVVCCANSVSQLHHQSVLVKPESTPITPLCTSLTTLTLENVRNAGTFRDAIQTFDSFAKEHLISKDSASGDPPTFAFVTLTPWDLKVQLPREARDKGVVLPAYLQHPVMFGLRSEYQTYQKYHPETLGFSASNLSSICAGLEVEEVRSSGKVTGGLPFHLQALAPSSPRRALDEAQTLTRCLRSLIQKSRPTANSQGTPEVLSRPLDARSDVRAFLNERSKVLHLSGLPHDTTQSELESWFTQYGGRPIAFWTLRTPEGGKPSGSGFVVFGSHEEAAESLGMNGRALNDRAIEVSPSSSRVLDRAANSQPIGAPPLLTPFPPSKNRPRPGDWTCPSCGFSNFQRRTACFRCSYPAMGGGPDPYGNGYGMPPQAFGGPGYNAGMMGGPHMHNPSFGMGGMGSSGRGGVVPFRAGDWKCGSENCGYHNFAKNITCLRCGASRNSAAVVAEGGMSSFPGSSFGTPSGMSPMASSGYGSMAPGGNGYDGNGLGGGYSAQSFNSPSFGMLNGLGGQPYGPGAYSPMPSHGGFDSRAEQAFHHGGSLSGSIGQYPTGVYGAPFEGSADPFSMLSGSMAHMALGGERETRVSSGGRPQ
ncbi:hypothetical protein K470DRAFT_220973 [Piedraia hortae CBS 480.64]|uniref:RNA-binding domain-containing protein n=1 Tax=Piedraia hortae CBS 480.64 TaxID=1314780 RepID=A0A6A7BTW1_9PEZI|nr:hypothetical protein K470DRAFT_220973 [Piedraia hortae CBS 480.64]